MIVVTGGAGFIGSNIVNELNNRGRSDILVVDNLGNKNKYKNLIGLQILDYLHKDNFLDSLKDLEIEAVFHEGACSDTMEYDVNYMMRNNYEYTKTLLKYCVEKSIPFIYASSASTYGDGKNGFRESDECESALNPYAFSKLMFDRYVRRFLKEAKSKIIGLRYFNVYGQQEIHKGKMASIVYQMYNQVNNTGKIKLFKGTNGYGDGEQKRDFIYVKDVVKVNLWCLENELENGIYNCGTGKAHSYNEMAGAVINAMSKGEIEYIDMPEVLRDKYQSYTQADMTKLLTNGYDGGFTEMERAVGEYIEQLDKSNGYY